jgi:hypothetical protein
MASRSWKGRTITGPDEATIDEVIRQLEQQETREARRRELWSDDSRVAMSRLCNRFPTLVGVPGTDPWDAGELLRWLFTSGAPTSGSVHAAKFVLQVWNASQDWEAFVRLPLEKGGLGIEGATLSPFNVVSALGVWDEAHAAGLRAWLELPFWP